MSRKKKTARKTFSPEEIALLAKEERELFFKKVSVNTLNKTIKNLPEKYKQRISRDDRWKKNVLVPTFKDYVEDLAVKAADSASKAKKRARPVPSFDEQADSSSTPGQKKKRKLSKSKELPPESEREKERARKLKEPQEEHTKKKKAKERKEETLQQEEESEVIQERHGEIHRDDTLKDSSEIQVELDPGASQEETVSDYVNVEEELVDKSHLKQGNLTSSVQGYDHEEPSTKEKNPVTTNRTNRPKKKKIKKRVENRKQREQANKIEVEEEEDGTCTPETSSSDHQTLLKLAVRAFLPSNDKHTAFLCECQKRLVDIISSYVLRADLVALAKEINSSKTVAQYDEMIVACDEQGNIVRLKELNPAFLAFKINVCDLFPATQIATTKNGEPRKRKGAMPAKQTMLARSRKFLEALGPLIAEDFTTVKTIFLEIMNNFYKNYWEKNFRSHQICKESGRKVSHTQIPGTDPYQARSKGQERVNLVSSQAIINTTTTVSSISPSSADEEDIELTHKNKRNNKQNSETTNNIPDTTKKTSDSDNPDRVIASLEAGYKNVNTLVVLQRDIERLKVGYWLNDEVINFFFVLLQRHQQ
jgi:hypothetical protein